VQSLVVVWLKRNGARWKESTAGEVIHLRALGLSTAGTRRFA
jgi:hypothetical protein